MWLKNGIILHSFGKVPHQHIRFLNNEAIFNMDKSGGGANLLAGDLYVLSNVAGDTNSAKKKKKNLSAESGIAPTTITSSKIIAGSISAGTFNIYCCFNRQCTTSI